MFDEFLFLPCKLQAQDTLTLYHELSMCFGASIRFEDAPTDLHACERASIPYLDSLRTTVHAAALTLFL